MIRSQALDREYFTDSAGTHGYHIGEPPDARAINLALSRGVDMRDLRARKVESADFDRFQYIVAMDSGHLSLLQRLRTMPSGGTGALSLFRTFGQKSPQKLDVPDPYYGSMADFEQVYDMIEAGCDAILGVLKRKDSHNL